ncbi:CsgG/HfaB family protein [Acinetobacter rathckeae]|uniref:CsgG/HfaB family protein n=1 Tax=Acinetobacter rathckeae TaxID=2605272 RepID=UPI0018A276BE|nr:CsgG/HfaB family protein [Acinetobacter rathckeae]MBF7687404.1 penicillin-binding protein activator LpoB [Acinetobacter rathckeae]MBF7694805.1 penicillin-binding protein activator LpoB [Acinetobacter rathckeae]
MKKYIYAFLVLLGFISLPAFAALKEVVKDTVGTGTTQQQAIAQALLTAVQSVNGTSVSSRVDYQSTVKMSVSNSEWNYKSQVSPVFSVDTTGSGSVNRYQVLSLTGSPNNYHAKVRVYVNKFQSNVQDQHLSRIAILPFRVTRGASYDDEFSSELADLIGTHITQSGKLSVLDRQYLSEMQQETDFLNWDGAPQELARLGQKVGVDYLVVGKITQIGKASQSMYGLNDNAEQVRLTWRVIEANTSKVAAAGTLNKTFSGFTAQNLVSGQENTTADRVAQELYQDILIGLKLQTGKTNSGSVDTSPDFEMTPGSSDKPLQW